MMAGITISARRSGADSTADVDLSALDYIEVRHGHARLTIRVSHDGAGPKRLIVTADGPADAFPEIIVMARDRLMMPARADDDKNKMASCDCCGEMVPRDEIGRVIAYGIETFACARCRGEEPGGES